jgi:hypothetical protein
MKRTHFITNSSSTSFIAYGIIVKEGDVNYGDKGLLHELDSEDGVEFIWDDEGGDCIIYAGESRNLGAEDQNLEYCGSYMLDLPPDASEQWALKVYDFCKKHNIRAERIPSWLFAYYPS